jgi:DNA-binding transcriptional ArsR family regulator
MRTVVMRDELTGRTPPQGVAAHDPQADMRKGRALNWEALVARSVHLTRLWIIEALLYIEQPLSATGLEGIFSDEELGISSISYHLKILIELGIVEEVRERKVRGATERFYAFTDAVLK